VRNEYTHKPRKSAAWGSLGRSSSGWTVLIPNKKMCMCLCLCLPSLRLDGVQWQAILKK